MTLDEINQSLADLSVCGNITFENAAGYIQGLIKQIQIAEIDPKDAEELLMDVQRQLQIVQDSQDLEYKESLNSIITSLLILLTVGINNI
jgi:hypothetical protein